MSRIPPASVRLTSGLLNYNQVGASEYYFNAHLKETITHDKIIDLLGGNIGFVTTKQKIKHLPLLVMGVLPIYTKLRAKKCYDRFFIKSYDWFRAKLFRGAQSCALRYHNAALFSQTRYTTIDDSTANVADYATWKGQKKQNSNNLCHSITSQFLQNLTSFRWKPKKSFIKISPWLRFETKSVHRVRRKATVPQYFGVYGTKNKSKSTQIGTGKVKKKLQESPDSIFPWSTLSDAKLKALLTPRKKKVKHIMAPLYGLPYKYRPCRAGLNRLAWSKNSIFALFCFEQIIGNINRSYAKSGLAKQGPSATTSSTHAQGLPCKSVTTKSQYRQKKQYRTFYDIQYIGMLSSECQLRVQNTRNIPRSQIDILRPKPLDDHLSRRFNELSAEKRRMIHTKHWSSQEGNVFKSRFLRTLQEKRALRLRRGLNDEHLLDFDRYVGRFRTNETPKFWVSRRFNAPTILNLFCFVTGKIAGKTRRQQAFQGGCSVSTGSACGMSRLKSGFLFEFDVISESLNKTKSLRPTMTLRF